MKLILEIPKEFERHYLNDKFEDSLKRLLSDTFLIENLLRFIYLDCMKKNF